jgi:4-diphosphocytidyl-2-C-methyl-D-erythritol kinase
MQGGAFIRSPAKVNLHLEVQSKRADGYHSIVSLFQLIDLRDEIILRSLKEKYVCRIRGMPDLADEKNLICRAVEAFRKKTGIETGFDFYVKKQIPPGGGLGGGSSNAACTLRLLNDFCNTGFTCEELAVLGEALGSDVPFFCMASCAVVTGRGERVRPIRGRTDVSVVLVFPEIQIDTKAAYELVDQMKELGKHGAGNRMDVSAIEREYRSKDPEKWVFYNSFEPIIRVSYPSVGTVLQDLYTCGGEYVQLSGSGSTCFAIFLKEERAKDALTYLHSMGYQARMVRLLDKSPNTVLQ